jgi:hypothetical protein
MMTIFWDFCIQYAVWNLQGWTSCHGPTGLVSLIIIILSVWFISCILQFLDTSDFAAMSSNYLMLINGRTVPMTGTTNVAFEFNLLAYCWFGIQPDLLIVSNPHTPMWSKKVCHLGKQLASIKCLIQGLVFFVTLYICAVLRTILLQVPTIPYQVGVVGEVGGPDLV